MLMEASVKNDRMESVVKITRPLWTQPPSTAAFLAAVVVEATSSLAFMFDFADEVRNSVS